MTDAEALLILRSLHAKRTLWVLYVDAEFSFESEQDVIDYLDGDATEISSFDVCRECSRIERRESIETGYLESLWPCRTAQAVLGDGS